MWALLGLVLCGWPAAVAGAAPASYKYVISWYDPLGAVLAFAAFFGFVAIASGTVLLWCCVDEAKDPSVFPAAYPRFGQNRAAVNARKARAQQAPTPA